jgi:hypothetical protein
MTPFGPGPITAIYRVVEVVGDLHGTPIVRYVQVAPQSWANDPRELPLDAFVGGYFAPHEEEAGWRKKPGWVRGAATGERPSLRCET